MRQNGEPVPPASPHARRSSRGLIPPLWRSVTIDKPAPLNEIERRMGPAAGRIQTVKPVLLRALAAAGLIVATLGFGTVGAGAQGVVKAQYGDWQMSCDTPPGASFQQCAIIQNVTAEDQPNVGLSVIVLKTADQKAKLLRVLAPLGVLLPNGLGLNVDGKDMGRVAFVRCLPNG